MSKKQITIWQYECDKCLHVWQGKFGSDIEPRMCAKCKSFKWNSGKGEYKPLETVKTSDATLPTQKANKRQIDTVKAQETAYQDTEVVTDFDFG